MPPAVLMAPVDTRSSLELMLELIQKRDELPKDAPPALPSRPISRGRLPSSRKSLPLPLNFKTRSISPEPSMNEDSDNMETKGEPIVKVDKEFSVQNRFFESHDKLKKVDLSEDSSSYVNKPQAESSDEKNSGEIGRLIYQMSGSEKVVDKILMKALPQIIGVEKCSNGLHACSSYEDFKKGATTFQSFIRGEIARHTFQFLMKRRMAVVIIQKYVRRWIARTKFFNQKEGIIHLQAVVRGQLAQKRSIVLKDIRMSNKLNEASSNWHLHKNFQETKWQYSKQEYVLVHRSVMEDLQMRVLKAEASLREKEEIHQSFQHQLEQYEMKMILMEEMWQKKMSLQDLNERHFEAQHSVKAELQRQILKAKGALMQKEEENIKLQQELHQYEIKWSQYEMKMKSMEEKWQKQLASLQLSLAAARKRLADDSASLPERSDSSSLWHSYDSESSMSTEARSPESTLANHPHVSGAGIKNDFTRKQKAAVNVLVQEFEQRKQAFEDGARFLMEAKSQQLDCSSSPDVELRKLKIEFASWKKDYKVRLREAKSAIHKLSKTRKDKPRKNWWCTGTA